MKVLVMVGSFVVTLCQHQVFRAVDDMTQPFRGACGEIVFVGSLSGYCSSALMLQQGTAIADVRFHLVDIDGVVSRSERLLAMANRESCRSTQGRASA